MLEQPKVYVFTRAYNAEKTIRRTVESVLHQTYQNITYVIRDNGSTDSTYAICKEYQEKDGRVVLVRNEKNNIFETEADEAAHQLELGVRYGAALGENDFFCLLDADDEYMPDFFEQAVRFAQEERLDIVAGGTEMIQGKTGEKISERISANNFCIAGQGFVKYFPQYHWFMRQVWGKLYRRNVLLGEQEYLSNLYQIELGKKAALGLPYGTDTVCSMYSFQCAKRVGLLAGCHHRYYVQEKSVSYSLAPNRIESDRILYKVAIAFLAAKGDRPICTQNRSFLQEIYANSVKDTVVLLYNSSLSPAEKLKGYCDIAVNPLTKATYHECFLECAVEGRHDLLFAALCAGAELGGRDDDRDLRTTVQELSPCCGRAVTGKNLMLFLKNQELLRALFQDDPEILLNNLFLLMKQCLGAEKSAIMEAIQVLAMDSPLLCQVGDPDFFKNYTAIYLMIWRGETSIAIDEMTGLLLENQVNAGAETFLQLYISLAAMENQAPAFVFGKFQLAWLFLRQGRKEECRAMVDELTELGVENEELSALRQEMG